MVTPTVRAAAGPSVATFSTSSALYYDPVLMRELKADLDQLIERSRQRARGSDAGICPDERQAAASLARNFGGTEDEQLAKIKAGKARA